jgi:hypothetical protein
MRRISFFAIAVLFQKRTAMPVEGQALFPRFWLLANSVDDPTKDF